MRHRLVIAARTADKLAETEQQCQQYTSHVHTVIADVSKEEDCKEIVNIAVEKFGGIDILILNAAITPTPQFFADSTKPVSDLMLSTHVHIHVPWSKNLLCVRGCMYVHVLIIFIW